MKDYYSPPKRPKKLFQQILFILGMGGMFIAVICLYSVAFALRTEEFTVNRTVYFLVLPAEESTSSVVAQDIYVSGGAGYVFSHKATQYVALAAYNDEWAARNVQGTLEKKGKETKILPLYIDTFYFKSKKEKENKGAIEGGVNTLLQCADLLYTTANGLETTRFTQGEARQIVSELQSVFNALKANAVAQTEVLLNYAVKKCREITSGIIYAKDVRYLQLLLLEGVYALQEAFDK